MFVMVMKVLNGSWWVVVVVMMKVGDTLWLCWWWQVKTVRGEVM